MNGDVYVWFLVCARACTFTRTSPDFNGDATWMQETCIYDGSPMTTFQPVDHPAT